MARFVVLTRWYGLALVLAALGVFIGYLIFAFLLDGRPKIGVIDLSASFTIDQDTAFVIGSMLDYTLRNDDIKGASRPFSRTRDGFVMGEGSGVLVLETLEHARGRGAEPLAEIAGFGSTADAFRITDMHPEGRGPAEAIRQALDDAGIDPEAVDDEGRPLIHYISAHGTGTMENDSIETLAVKRVFGTNAPRIPISSIKSMMGHLIAAAGAVELITCVLAMQHQKVPPTINLHDPDPELDLDYVPNEARDAHVETCLSNSFGFGGQNDTLIVRKFT